MIWRLLAIIYLIGAVLFIVHEIRNHGQFTGTRDELEGIKKEGK